MVFEMLCEEYVFRKVFMVIHLLDGTDHRRTIFLKSMGSQRCLDDTLGCNADYWLLYYNKCLFLA